MTGDVELLTGLALLVLVCVTYLGPWQWAWADHARQSVFEERDAIFDMARVGDLEFGSDAYETVRAGLNSLIRFAHRSTGLRLLFHFALRRPSVPRIGRFQAAVMGIEDEAVRRKVMEHVDRAERAFVASLVARSVITFIVLFIFLFGRYGFRGVGGSPLRLFSDAYHRACSVVEAEANAICA